MNAPYFSGLVPELARRGTLGTVSWLGFSNVPLRKHLTNVFAGPYGQTGSFLADPAFEPVFGWREGDRSMAQLSGSLLSEALVNAMDDPPKDLVSEYRFPKQRVPYEHQIKAWEVLAQTPPKSLVVTSGTGSGKTECFMVPILDALARERESVGGQLRGVRALFLYPLNALINSQRDRLRAWTARFGSDVRFCLYNGLTPEQSRAGALREHVNEVQDRKTLRSAPPPILVTNATMLEYMLVRTQDAPILESSQGKLQWVVLDEAHSYIGSQAAEMALLMRRVLHAFGVEPNAVRFVATSATIGDPDGEAGRQLRDFLSQIAGVDPDRVHVVAGRRQVPELPAFAGDARPDDLGALLGGIPRDADAAERYGVALRSGTARKIRDLFVHPGAPAAQRLSAVCLALFGPSTKFTRYQQDEALAWLDLLSGSVAQDGTPFLPLRTHLFHQTLSGIWACADGACPHLLGTALHDPAWPFGTVYLAPRQHCSCGAPAYELVSCDDCGSLFLEAEEDRGRLVPLRGLAVEDEFELDAEPDVDRESDDETSAGENEDLVDRQAERHAAHRILIANRDVPQSGEAWVARADRTIVERGTDGALSLVVHESSEDGIGCPCCGAAGDHRRVFRAARVGAPFLLGGILPTLLEFAPDAVKPAGLPYRGRRVLTFSDSRQGTARLAARLQQDSERAKTRGLIFHHALLYSQSSSDPVAAEIESEIEGLADILATVTDKGHKKKLEELIEKKRAGLAQKAVLKPIPFADLRGRIAAEREEFAHMLSAYRERSRPFFGGDDGGSLLSGILLVREFGRRPKRQNNLETMGLIATQYPKLDRVTAAPRVWSEKGLTTQDWKDFLKIALDFFVRGGFSLNVDDSWRNWLGFRASRTTLVGAAHEGIAKGQRYWPSAKRSKLQSGLVRLLAKTLNCDVETAIGCDVVDDILRSAWDELIRVQLLTRSASGYHLLLEDLAFSPMKQAWICPVTRRFLDTSLRGATPYIPKLSSDATTWARRVELPLYDKPFGAGQDFATRIHDARAWLDDCEAIRHLREEGLWSVMADRAIELAPYFVTAEHSAQQPAVLLDRYEKAFKEGRINLLSCSTTMEMGIDIGGVQVVAMNNTPPHPANYLQRAGRAGRRQETRSAAVTLCKSNPHDQAAFANSRWAFEAQLPAPVVSLNSSVIVQRHVNSMVLSQFLKDLLVSERRDLNKLTNGWFFVAEGKAPAARFIAWGDAFEAGGHPRLEQGLARLVRHSVFEGMPAERLIRTSALEMTRVSERWMSEWRGLSQQEANLGPANPNDPAVKAIGLQRRRLSDEYLLRELATGGFLPAYGFPSNITSFDNLTRATAERLRVDPIVPDGASETRKRIDNRFQRRDLASRDVVSALREYAPGAEVVMDGLVYRSAGITLNWHIPASQQDAREVQAIHHAWRCRRCGASGAAWSLDSARVCNSCGSENRSSDIQRFLEPAGFTVDFYESPHNDVSSQSFIPVARPWINARGEWSLLSNPALGRYRTTPEGGVYHHSAGLWGKGYALCLSCGRAEPMLADGSLPKVFAEKGSHKRLRSRADDRTCPGSTNRWSIQEGISLGHYGRTDVLEIQLRDTAGLWLNDRVAALTLAVALRDSLAELLGIQTIELGCDVKPVRTENEEECQSILIFDHHAAGYSGSAMKFMDEVFRRAARRLDCPQNCDRSCPSCVLDFDQRFEAESIDRHVARQFLSPQWLDLLRLPSELRLFGEGSQVEPLPLAAAVQAASGQAEAVRTRLFFAGKAEDFDIAASGARRLAYRIGGLGRAIELVIARDVFAGLSDENRHALASLADQPHVEVRLCTEAPMIDGAFLLAEVERGDGVLRWGTRDAAMSVFGRFWGEGQGPLVVAHLTSVAAIDTEPLQPDAIRPPVGEGGDREIVVHGQLNGSVQGFGERFWSLVADEHAASRALLDHPDASVTRVTYSDRYLFTPIAVALLVDIVAGLRSRVGVGRWANPYVAVKTMGARENVRGGPPLYVFSDWLVAEDRDDVLAAALAYVGIDGKVTTLDRQQLAHGRVMQVDFDDGATLAVRFDQGVSYWRVPRLAWRDRGVELRFNFYGGEGVPARRKSAIDDQAMRVAELRVPVEGDAFPTELFAKVRRASRA